MGSIILNLVLVTLLTLRPCESCPTATKPPSVHIPLHRSTYTGIHQSGIEYFFPIPYGLDTGGSQRFKLPQPFSSVYGSTIDATTRGPTCPQPLGNTFAPFYFSNITSISEDCLHLNIYRLNSTTSHSNLPVLPVGLILQAVENGTPVLAVTVNYRLGVFGFAQGEAWGREGSTNAGYQTLAIEWVRDNVVYFGGNPGKVTILGQSSGGHSVGMQLLAYGGRHPAPFRQAIAQSQFLDLGITGNVTQTAMRKLVAATPCNETAELQTPECLRGIPMRELLAAQTATYGAGAAENAGDVWLPVVDGDFLPAAPSQLMAQGRLHSVPTLLGWTDSDGVFFVGKPSNEENVEEYFRQYLPSLTPSNLDKLLVLYPTSDFTGTANVSAQTYRSGRILKDIVQTCQPLLFGRAVAEAGSEVFVYDQNQTILGELLQSTGFSPDLGPVHTAEMAYVMGNLSHYEGIGYPFNPTPADLALRNRQSRSWATFVRTGKPSLTRHGTLKRWLPAFRGDDVNVFVVGGPDEGLSVIAGPGSTDAMRQQRLRERCSFINSPEIVAQLQY